MFAVPSCWCIGQRNDQPAVGEALSVKLTWIEGRLPCKYCLPGFICLSQYTQGIQVKRTDAIASPRPHDTITRAPESDILHCTAVRTSFINILRGGGRKVDHRTKVLRFRLIQSVDWSHKSRPRRDHQSCKYGYMEGRNSSAQEDYGYL